MSNTIYNGWTEPVSEQERATAEVEACLELVELYPQVEYWQERLAASIVHEYEVYHPELEPIQIPEAIEYNLDGMLEFADARAMAYMEAVPLNEMTPEQQREWFENIEEEEF